MGISMSAAADWDMFRQGPQRTGWSDAATVAPPVSERWRFKTEGPIYSSPAISGNVAYVGSRDKRVYAVDIATGKEKWRFETGDFVDSSPAVSGGKVYVASRDGAVYALDAATGKQIWKNSIGGAHNSSPLVVSGKVIIGAGAKETLVYALNAETGAVEWKLATGQPVSSSASALGGVVYIGSNDGKYYAIDIATGKEKWSVQTDGGIFLSSPLISNNLAIGAPGDYDRSVSAWAAADGKPAWQYTMPGEGKTLVSSPAADSDTVYVNSGYKTSTLYAINSTTGALRWKTNTGEGTEFGYLSSPAVGKEYVWVGSADGKLLGIDKKTGAVKANIDLGKPILSSPALTADKALVASTDGFLYAFW